MVVVVVPGTVLLLLTLGSFGPSPGAAVLLMTLPNRLELFRLAKSVAAEDDVEVVVAASCDPSVSSILEEAGYGNVLLLVACCCDGDVEPIGSIPPRTDVVSTVATEEVPVADTTLVSATIVATEAFAAVGPLPAKVSRPRGAGEAVVEPRQDVALLPVA